MSTPWDHGLERDFLGHLENYQAFERHEWRDEFDRDAAIDTLLVYALILEDPETPIALSRPEVSELTAAVYWICQHWQDFHQAARDLEIDDLDEEAYIVHTAREAEQLAFLEHKVGRATMAQYILAIIDNPDDDDLRYLAGAVTINELHESDIHDTLDLPVTQAYFLQQAAGVHRPDAKGYEPLRHLQPRPRKEYQHKTAITLRQVVRSLEKINHESAFSRDGSVEIDSEQATDLRRALQDAALDIAELGDIAQDIGLFYKYGIIEQDDEVGAAKVAHVEAYEAEIDYRVALLTALLVLIENPRDEHAVNLGRQMAEAELADAAWHNIPPKR